MKQEERFNPFMERDQLDCGMCSRTNGYAQIATKQDAPYFGTWINPTERKIVCFAEGDLTIKTAADDDELITALRSLAEWNRARGWGFAIEPTTNDGMTSVFKRLGVADLLA